MEEGIPLSSFAMRTSMDPSHRDDSDSSYSTPKGKSIDPDDSDPDDYISYSSSSSNGAKKPEVATNGNKGTKATSLLYCCYTSSGLELMYFVITIP